MESPEELQRRVELYNLRLQTAAQVCRQVGMETTAETLDQIADGTLFEKLVGYADKMAECKLNEELEKRQLQLTAAYMAKVLQMKLEYDIAKAVLAPSPFTLYQEPNLGRNNNTAGSPFG